MGSIVPLRLSARPPFDAAGLRAVLRARAAPGLERLPPDGSHVRAVRGAHGPAVLVLDPPASATSPTTTGRLLLADDRDAAPLRAAVGRLLDLDADPVAVGARLSRDPVLAPLVRARPGLRVMGALDPFELVLRAVIGQQVSVAAARRVLGRLVVAHGTPVPEHLDPDPSAGPLLVLPGPAAVAVLPDEALPMPRARAATVRRVAAAVADGTVDLRPGADPQEAVRALLALRGVGPWTAGYVAMRALGDRDAFPAGDLVLRRTAAALGLPGDARGLAAHAERWAPDRAAAAQHLWAAAAATGGGPVGA